MKAQIESLTIRGFRSIRTLDDFRLAPLTVLIGANGSGKSNFVSFFRLLSWMNAPAGQLQEYVALCGGAATLLHDGPSRTPQLEAEIAIRTQAGENRYAFRLFHAAGDTLVFAEEKYRFAREGASGAVSWREMGAGHREAGLVAQAERGEQPAGTIRALLQRCVVHQFHNTSGTARIRQKWHRDDSRYLKEDAGNLAPFLLRLREEQPGHYTRIVETLRDVLPFFTDFVLEPDPSGSVLLRWAERGTDQVFGASQASDGMLRTMALFALLLQPEEDLPVALVLDEPELGLHPWAISVAGALMRSASRATQIVVATQSADLLNEFQPEDVVVVDRSGGQRESRFARLDAKDLAEWLREYTLAELWAKNVVGGRP